VSTTSVAPIDPGQVLDQAIAALKTPRFADVLPDLDRALQAAPNDPRLWHVKGMILRRLERREDALPVLTRAVELAPREPIIVHSLARVRSEAGLPSVDAYAHALRVKPRDPAIMLGLCAALVAEHRIGEAIEGLERVLERSPLWVDGHVALAGYRWTEGERAGFARSFDEALARHPSDNSLRWQQLTTLLHAEQFDAVLRAVADGRRHGADDMLLTANEAAAQVELGNTAEADRLLALVEHLPDATVHLRRVRHLLKTGRLQQASAVIDQWVHRDTTGKFWPYAATTWRMLSDPRWEWLEGDPRLVGTYDISDRIPPLDELAAFLRTLHTTRGQPLEQSVRGGTQTDGHLFQRIEPQIIALREAVRQAVEQHAAQLPPADPAHPLLRTPRAPIRFSGAWSVRLRAGGRHSNHVHPQGWLSSAFYLVLPPDLGNADAGLLTLGEPHEQLGLDVPPVRTVEPKPGRLVLFPSTMWHGTRAFGAGERMTVAFDVAVPG
jgi:Flp pilus assembly protein TadD